MKNFPVCKFKRHIIFIVNMHLNIQARKVFEVFENVSRENYSFIPMQQRKILEN